MAQSPCVKICEIDEAQRMCRGCFRTLAEIARWGSLSDQDQQAILKDLPRRQESFSEALTP